MPFRRTAVAVAVAGVALTACADTPSDLADPGFERVAPPLMSTASAADGMAADPRLAGLQLPAGLNGDPEGVIAAIDADLAARGIGMELERVEWVSAAGTQPAGTQEAGNTLIRHDQQLRLSSRWVPGDERRPVTPVFPPSDPGTLTHVIFGPFEPANWNTPDEIPSAPSIDASFATWGALACSDLHVQNVADLGVFPSLIITGGVAYTDIGTVGFLPGSIFDAVLGPGSSSNVLGVTFTFRWINTVTGEPTDIDGNGRDDTAFKEVWYNDDFLWATDGTPGAVDIETVALHENGHVLEIGHFGKVMIKNNGTIKASPRAVMNAFILGELRSLLGTDKASYCSNFANWPG